MNILNLTLQNGADSGAAASAIRNISILSLRRCLLQSNTDNGNNASIYNLAGGTLEVLNCTFSDNFGGDVILSGGSLTVRDSTLFANHVNFATIQNFGVMSIRNTIVAGSTNIVLSGTKPDVIGPVISEGYNLIGDVSQASGFGSTGDQLGASAAQVKLTPLQDNGGLTLTRYPLSGSPTIDQGNRGTDNNGQPINTDGRGSARPMDQAGIGNAVGGDGSDIGAVETGFAQAGPPTPLLVRPLTMTVYVVPMTVRCAKP